MKNKFKLLSLVILLVTVTLMLICVWTGLHSKFISLIIISLCLVFFIITIKKI
jgi:hypothetical protein